MASNARSELAPGTRFGRYEVITEIASGGMAVVYLARVLGAAGFQRLVAIKLMHAQYANDDEFVGMFMDEARLAARIRHPNVVPTLDLENDDDGLYLAMEYVEGDTLLGLLRAASRAGQRIPPAIVIRVVLDVLNGLHAAHELTGDAGESLGLVHRDVSPHNVLVGVDGISRITDFGVARAGQRVTSTRNGQIKGKLAYMAPEQTTSVEIDRRADLFAMGVVLWECLAGKRLMAAPTDAEVLRNLLVTPIAMLRDVMPEVPEAIERVCMKALARDRDERFANAAEMAEALEQSSALIGIASTRAVSEFVRANVGDKMASLHERVLESSTHEASSHTPSRIAARRDRSGERVANAVRPPPLPRAITLPVIPPRRSGGPMALVAAFLLAVLAVSGSGFDDGERAQWATTAAISPSLDPTKSSSTVLGAESTPSQTDGAATAEPDASSITRNGTGTPATTARSAARRPLPLGVRARPPVRSVRAPFNPESM